MSFVSPNIKSEDIDLTKFSIENLQRMRDCFPGYKDEDFARLVCVCCFSCVY